MTADAMAGFLERLGHRVIHTRSASWYDAHRHFYLSFPHHRLVEPGPDELLRLFGRFCAGVRYFAPADGLGRPSYAFVCRDRHYDLDTLSPNSRSKIRRGLKQCEVRRLSPDYVRMHGREANDDTLRRIRIRDPYGWETYWQAVEQSDCVEVWGASVGEHLASYLVAVRVDRCCEILVARSSSPYLRYYPNNALLFTVVREMVSRADVDQVFFGVESLESLEGIDQFKISMGFAKEPIRQRIVPHPVLRPAIASPGLTRLVRKLLELRPQSELLRKLNGVMALSSAT